MDGHRLGLGPGYRIRLIDRLPLLRSFVARAICEIAFDSFSCDRQVWFGFGMGRMQGAEEPARGGTGTQAAEPARTLSPIAAFLILLVIGAVALGALLLTREDEAEEPSAPDRGPAFALTDEEAIERFHELAALHIRAYRERDLSLVSQIFVPGSRISETVTDEIRTLIRRDVIDQTTFESEKVEIVSNEPSQITMRQTVLQTPRFIKETGKAVTPNPAQQRLVIEWFLQPINSKWLVSEATVVDAKKLGTGQS